MKMKNLIEGNNLSERQIAFEKCFMIIMELINKVRTQKRVFRMAKNLFEISIKPYKCNMFSLRKEFSLDTTDTFIKSEFDKLIDAAENNFGERGIILECKLFPYEDNRLIISVIFKKDGKINFTPGNVERYSRMVILKDEEKEKEFIKQKIKDTDRKQARLDANIILAKKRKKEMQKERTNLNKMVETIERYFPKSNMDSEHLMEQILSSQILDQDGSVEIVGIEKIEKQVEEEKSRVRTKVVQTIQKPDHSDRIGDFEIEFVDNIEDSSFPTGDIPVIESVRPDSIRVVELSDIKSLVDESVGQTRNITPLNVPNLDYAEKANIDEFGNSSLAKKNDNFEK